MKLELLKAAAEFLVRNYVNAFWKGMRDIKNTKLGVVNINKYVWLGPMARKGRIFYSRKFPVVDQESVKGVKLIIMNHQKTLSRGITNAASFTAGGTPVRDP